jgi:cytosine/adenosine deaminase-related metal-dependent hydrolase
MTYRKFRADLLFTGQEMADSGSVLVTADDGTVQGVIPAAEAGDGVEYYPGLLTPGFVNCHCHLELSPMRGVLPEKTGLVDFLAAVIRQRNVVAVPETIAGGQTREDLVRDPIDRAEQEMLDNGIVAVGDICNTTDTLDQKTAGRLYYHNFIETMGFAEQTAAARFESGLKVFNAFAAAYALPIASNSIVPHAPYSVSAALFRLIAGFPGNQVLTIHNQETEAENTFYLSGEGDFLRLYQLLGLDVSFFRGTGKRSLESYLPYFYKNQSLILVHNVATREEDLRAAMGMGQGIGGQRSGAMVSEEAVSGAAGPDLYFCLCPNANLYITGQLPDVDLLVRYDSPVVIGTDSLASNHQLSILEEIKTLQAAFPWLETATLLRWATYNGAKALQLGSVVGSFGPGKQPGIVLLENMDGGRFKAGTSVRRLL